MVDINKLIDVNFNIVRETTPIGSYKKAVYFMNKTANTAFNGYCTYLLNEEKGLTRQITNIDGKDKDNAPLTVDTFNKILSTTVESNPLDPNVINNLHRFFDYDGQELIVVLCDNKIPTADDVQSIKKTFQDFIYYTVSQDIFNSLTATNINDLNEDVSAPYTVRLCLTVKNTEENEAKLAAVKNNNIFVKLVDTTVKTDDALAFLAFTTQIRLDGFNTIEDYCYTDENGLEVIDSKDHYDTWITKYNFVEKVGNKVLNFGGNLYDGTSIDSDFGVTCIENDIAYALLDIVTSKIRITPTAQTRVVTAINTVLNRYINNGLILSNSVYSGEDMFIKYNEKTYSIIHKGTTLLNGYYVFTVPVSAISVEDKQNKKFTPIIVVIMTSAGARTISVSGYAY
jgi:hypothetical protein|nr:MAG TPA: Protein of unknown function (DUF3383) [Caudoviricetes sp.]